MFEVPLGLLIEESTMNQTWKSSEVHTSQSSTHSLH